MQTYPHRPSSRFAFVLVAAAALGSDYGYSQSISPSDSQGSSTKALGQIELANEIDGVEGRQLRARAVTIEPGGHTSAHSHKGRPTLEYVLQGEVVEIRNGVEIVHKAGEMIVARQEVTHWWENRGTVPVVLLPVDVFKP